MAQLFYFDYNGMKFGQEGVKLDSRITRRASFRNSVLR